VRRHLLPGPIGSELRQRRKQAKKLELKEREILSALKKQTTEQLVKVQVPLRDDRWID
jgi:hypothetical protein